MHKTLVVFYTLANMILVHAFNLSNTLVYNIEDRLAINNCIILHKTMIILYPLAFNVLQVMFYLPPNLQALSAWATSINIPKINGVLA